MVKTSNPHFSLFLEILKLDKISFIRLGDEHMEKIIDLTCEDARAHFLKGSSYFNNDIPNYLDFEPVLHAVDLVLNGNYFRAFQANNPKNIPGVNYSFLSNKDGNFAWRPLEFIHPAIYISLVDLICKPENWCLFQKRFKDFKYGAVDCCSDPVISLDEEKDKAKQIEKWWQQVEQQSIIYSLEFSHILHTDVTDCYGSLYTHSIAWALHGLEESKDRQNDPHLLGNMIDTFIRAGRYGQTNGISQGSVLMDFLAELVLGYIDEQISSELATVDDFRILRYRDDYRIFTNNDELAENILKVISEQLRPVGMRLGASKTRLSRNVVEESVKPDKLAGIDLEEKGETDAISIQKQLLRLHGFGLRFPNSGALRRLLSNFHKDISKVNYKFDNLEVLVAILTDIAYVSPSSIPAVAGIMSYLISRASTVDEKQKLWTKVHKKMTRVPNNGYLEVWLQRVTKPKEVGLQFSSEEPICKIVNKKPSKLWENMWISSHDLIRALDVSQILVADASEAEEVIKPEEIELFTENAWFVS